jgi:pimeloyl-ACP methyl ester carboxylesterase
MNPRRRRRLIYGIAAGVALSLLSQALHRARRRRYRLAHHINRETWDALRDLPVPARSEYLMVGDVQLHTVLAGPEDGPLVVLLHGFPENWYSWRHQIPLLVDLGYRVAVPDQRGYNLSEKPGSLSAYELDRLTGDVMGLVRALGRESAVIVGHDWGGVVAWRFAMDYPEAVQRLVVMNAPHPAAYARELREGWEQRLKSWYALFFQIPWLPETLLGFSPRATARLFFERTVEREGAFSEEELAYMATALAQPGALRTMINWYRAALRRRELYSARTIESPTLLIWGEEDPALTKALTYDLTGWVPHLRVRYVLNCGHWVQNEAPDEVNAELRDFLAR